MSPFVFIGISTVFGVSGQLLLKRGMTNMDTRGSSFLLRLVTSPWVMGGLAIYGMGVVFWLLALSHLELSYAYPFASLSYIGIILGSYFLFKERINRLRILGIAVIILGVLITSMS